MASGYKFNRVMLIDDNDIDNLINSRIITSHNFASVVDVKTSTESALEHLRALAADSPNIPSVIFLDLNMPGMDGFIKNKSKVVVLSSSISPEDINKASTNAYVVKYINKPLSDSYLDAINF